MLDEFRLHHVRKNNGDSLSGGERRRTEIARALAVDPKFILLDEPFAGVDPIAVEDIQAVVARLKYRNIGILITDHNVNETLSICDRAYLLIEGKIFKHGTAEELADDEQVRRLYLGRNFELKRKDYLHEEAKGKNRPDLSSIIRSVESAMDWAQKIEEADTRRQRAVGFHSGNTQTEIEDLNLDDYARFINELKQSLSDYAKGKQQCRVKGKSRSLAFRSIRF